MSDFNKSAYDAAYHKTAIVQVSLKLNRIHDADIISHLEQQPNKQAYLKRLIQQDIDRSCNEA